MERFWLLLLCLIVLAFCVVVYIACRSWRRVGPKKRIAGVLLLLPHFLLVVSIVVSLVLSASCGHAALGSPCFNAQFVWGVLLVFILPVPALVGTVAAVTVFLSH